MKLSELKIGETAIVTAVEGEKTLRQHFLDMGLIPGTRVLLQKFAPMGDPMQLQLHGYELTLRMADASKISVDVGAPESADDDMTIAPARSYHKAHPRFGEEHITAEEKRSATSPYEGKNLTFALAGNQNCGKTTLFNQLTGANQHVGNFPGVTVDQKSGPIRGYARTTVTDLPGIYSLSPYTSEEVVSRQHLLNAHPHCIINIVDATNIERNLYLTMQLMELGIPMVLALNMMDEMEGNGGTVRINEMEADLGIPVVPISAAKNQGVDELVQHAMHVAYYNEPPARRDFCVEDEGPAGAVHRCLHAIMHFIHDHAKRAGIPVRFAACKLVEGDPLVEEALQLSQNERETIEHILVQMEEERGLDRAAAMADMRFSFIRQLTHLTVVKPQESREHRRSMRIDRILTGRWTALPTFALIMALIFWLTFDVIGGNLQELFEYGIGWFTSVSDAALTAWNVDHVVHSLIIDGIYAGVGSVASFVPIIVTLFFFLSLLEDSGYMARIAFVMDKLLRRLGLSGRSIVPLLVGFGCSVPAIMSSRTLPSERDRRLTVLLIPFMSCTAKLPIYAFFCAVFFPEHAALMMIALYGLGIVVGIITARVLKFTAFRGHPVPFVMELPNYRLPSTRTVLMLLWEKAADFLQRAFTVIFAASIVIWFLQSFSFHLSLVDDASQSILAQVADVISPLFAPLGFSDWRITTSLVSGFMAKESVVSTLGILFGAGTTLSTLLSTASAAALLVFCLLYTPCVAAIASIRRELGVRYACIVVCGQCLIAWIVALFAYHAWNLFA